MGYEEKARGVPPVKVLLLGCLSDQGLAVFLRMSKHILQ